MITLQNMEDLIRLYNLIKSMRKFSSSGQIRFTATPAESAALEELLRSIVEGEFDDSAPVSASWVFGWLLKYSRDAMLPVRYQEGLFDLVACISSKQAAPDAVPLEAGGYGPGIRMAFDMLLRMSVDAEDNTEAGVLLDAAMKVIGLLDATRVAGLPCTDADVKETPDGHVSGDE